MRIIQLSPIHYESLEKQEKYVQLTATVQSLRRTFDQYFPGQGTLYNISSTEHGGGVAEMIPKILMLLRELGAKAEWAVVC
jgi:trehalose synthase